MTNSIVFIDATIVPGNGRDPVARGAVCVEDGRITRVDETRRIHAGLLRDPETKVVDLAGRTLMPGMVDCHFHGGYERAACVEDYDLRYSIEQTTLFHAKNAGQMLRTGFTSVREVGARGLVSVAASAAIRQGFLRGPRLVPGGRILSSTGGLVDNYGGWVTNNAALGHIVDGPEEIRRAVRDQLKYGTRTVKVEANGAVISPYSSGTKRTMSEEEMAAAVYEAGRNGARVAAHARTTAGIREAVRAGVATVEHGTYLDEECADLMLKNGTYLVPTLTVLHLYATKGSELGVSPFAVRQAQESLADHEKAFRLASGMGVPFAVGSDSGHVFNPQGTAAIELELMVRFGVSPLDAITAATHIGAKAIGMGSSVGLVSEGYLADLLVLDRSPVDDITVLQDCEALVAVYQSGRLRGGTWSKQQSDATVDITHDEHTHELELPYEDMPCC